MNSTAKTLAGVLAALAVLFTAAASPSLAISVELAKKCRELAVKAHPPPAVLGGKAYAQAERDYFRDCVAKNGNMQENPTPPASQRGNE